MRCNNCSNEIDVSVGFQSIMVLGYVSVYERLGYRAICGNLLRREKCKKKHYISPIFLQEQTKQVETYISPGRIMLRHLLLSEWGQSDLLGVFLGFV